MQPRGTFVSLYAGCGGMDIGFAQAGFRPIWTNEIDPAAAETHDSVFKQLSQDEGLPHLAGSLPEVSLGSIDAPGVELPARGAADLVIGGPPCQGFSVAGQMRPDDPRSKHVFRFMQVVDHLRPRAFVMENVKGLYESRRWSSVRERLIEEAARSGYTAHFFLANASHYEVPQARERMFLIGVEGGEPSFPEPVSAGAPMTVRNAFEALPKFGEPGNDSLCRAKITFAKKPVMRRSPWAGMMFNGAGRPLDLERPALTLPASMGGNKTPIIDQEALEHGCEPWVLSYHKHLMEGGEVFREVPTRLRRLTVEEAAAIQTFPQGMEWRGQQSSRFRQIGNAVPPKLAEHVAQHLAEVLR